MFFIRAKRVSNCYLYIPKKKFARVRVYSTNLVFSVGYACVRLILVLVWGTYYVTDTYVPGISRQKSRHVRSIAWQCIYMNPTHGPRAWSLDDRQTLRAGGREQWTVLSGTITIGHGLHVVDRAQGLTGAQSGVRCRAQPRQHESRGQHARVSTRTTTNKPFRNRVVPVVGYVYTSIYYCCKSFPVLFHDVMVGEWIASYVFVFIRAKRVSN